MASIYDIKPAFQSLLRPTVNTFSKWNIQANQVTVFTCLISMSVGFFVWQTNGSRLSLVLVPVWLFLRMALNAIDGMLAREHNQKSNLGAILNELTDVISDVFLYLPFAVLPSIDPQLIVVLVLLSVISEMAGITAIQIRASRRYDGPMGKSDRAFIFGVLSLLFVFDVSLDGWINFVLWGVIVLLIFTVFNRCSKALIEARTRTKL